MPLWLWTVALLPRLALCARAAFEPALTMRGDSLDYLSLAQNLATHGVFSMSPAAPYAPQIVRTPGYPLFLMPLVAVFASPLFAAALIQSLLGALTVVMAWRWMSVRDAGRGALFGALFLALDPVLVLHTPLILTETLFVLLIVAAGALTVRALSAPTLALAAASGALWGASIFVRPISLYLPFTLAWFWRKNMKAMAMFLACAYVLPAAWTLHNRMSTGRAVYAAVAGLDMLRYPAAGIEVMRTGRPWGELEVELRSQVDASYPDGFPDEAVKAQAYNSAAMKIIRPHPFLLLRYCLQGAIKLLGGTGLEMFLEWGRGLRGFPVDASFRPSVSGSGTVALLRAHPGLIPIEFVYVIALAALYGLTCVGLWRMWTTGRREEAFLLAWVSLYFLGLSSSQGYYRFRIPMIPFLCAAAAAAFPRAGEKS